MVRDQGSQPQLRRLLVHARGEPDHIGDVRGLGDAQPDVAIDPAVEGVIGLDRGRHRIAKQVIDLDGQHVIHVPKFHIIRHVQFKAGVAALVLADAGAIKPELRHTAGAFEFKKYRFAGVLAGQLEMLAIPADAPPVAGRLVHRVVGVPGVRQVNGRPIGIVVPGGGGVTKVGFDAGGGFVLTVE